MAAFMIESIVYFGIGSFLGALPVVALSLPVIVNRRASLTIQVQTLKEELSQARERTTAAEDRRDATLRAKESELAMLTNVLEEHSVLIDFAESRKRGVEDARSDAERTAHPGW